MNPGIRHYFLSALNGLLAQCLLRYLSHEFRQQGIATVASPSITVPSICEKDPVYICFIFASFPLPQVYDRLNESQTSLQLSYGFACAKEVKAVLLIVAVLVIYSAERCLVFGQQRQGIIHCISVQQHH